MAGLRQHAIDAGEPAQMAARKPLLVGNEPVLIAGMQPERMNALDMHHDPSTPAAQQRLDQAALARRRPAGHQTGLCQGVFEQLRILGEAVIVGLADDQDVGLGRF